MSSAPPSRSAELTSAREARALLSETSRALQLAPATPELERVIESVALASGALYALEATGPVSEDYRAIRGAIKHLSDALSLLQTLSATPGIDSALEGLARTLALLYPVARTHQRKRRQVIMDIFGEPDSMVGLARPAPEPLGEAPRQPGFSGANKRDGGDRVFLEVDIGFASQSHFYTGLSRDVSRGGVFVATYEPQPPGTEMVLHFVLPNGRAVKARGVVRWTVEARDDLAPGMGIAFDDIASEDLGAIVDFCGERSPLYHEVADD
jgi:uncharacterized protein (TIGR02266 family)